MSVMKIEYAVMEMYTSVMILCVGVMKLDVCVMEMYKHRLTDKT